MGNGRLGVMVYGGSGREELQLNEETIWAGGPHNNVSPEALAALPEVRRLIFGGKYDEAFELCDEKFSLHASHGMPYQTAGSLLLDFPGHQVCSEFYRDLNLETAVATVRYVVDGVRYAEEPSVKKVSHREGDYVLAVDKTVKAEKDGELLPGQYTVLSGADGVDAFNVRVGGFVRELHHGDTIVLGDGEEITAVSHTAVLR